MGEPTKSRILVVDDEEAIGRLCIRILSQDGCDVTAVPSAEDALKKFRPGAFDLVLTDLTMPGMGGVQLLSEIKNMSPETDVIIMTGFPTLETAIPTLRQGAYDYLIKPFDAEPLRAVVRRCLEKRSLSDELNREKSLRMELQAAYAQLQEMDELKAGFISRVNHELRIPLAPAFLALDLLTSQVTDKPSAELIDMLRARLDQMRGIVEELLLFVDLKKNEFDWVKTDVQLRDLSTNLLERLKSEFEPRQIKAVVHIPDDAAWTWADPELLETLLRHLVLNAVRFNRPGGSVEIRAEVRNSQTAISVRDNGPGIPPEKLGRIFDSFYQVADYLTREVGGLGLGLALVRRIAELHGGTVSVQSELGKGTTFTVLIPRLPSATHYGADAQAAVA